jgi:hypothetical protein
MTTAWGAVIISIAPRDIVIHGVYAPYPKRTARSRCTGTMPSKPWTMRISEFWSPNGMKSMMRTAPPSHSKSVSRISVPGR